MKLKISIVASVIFLFARCSIFAAIPPAENLLPADTLALVTVPDWTTLRSTMKRSPEWLMWNDPAMTPFREDFYAKWKQKFLASMEQSLGIHMADYLPLLQGQFTLAVTQNGWSGGSDAEPAMLLLLDTKGKSDLLTTNLAALKDEWIKSGKPVKNEVLQGIKFTVVLLSTNASVPFAPSIPQGTSGSSSKTFYIGQYKSLLIAGTSVEAVESVAAHLSGGANPALSQNEQFVEDQLSQFHNAPLYYGWLNSKAVVSILAQSQSASSSDSSPFSWSKVLLASGLQGLNSVSFAYRESREGAQIEIYANVPESTREGIFKIIAASPKNANPPPFVPANAIKFWRWRIDGQKSWTEIQRTLASISPTAVGGLNSFLAMADINAQQQDPNFSIRKNLIDNLGDDWISYSMAPRGKTAADLNSAPYLFLFGANNADQTVLALKTVAGMLSAGSTPQSRDFLGRKIFTITLPARGATGSNNAAKPTYIYITASGGYVAVTTDVSMIESYLRSDDGKTKPLSDTPGLVEAAEHVGGMGNGLFGYQNQLETGRALFSVLKNDPGAGAAALGSVSAFPVRNNSINELMDFSLLPDYDAIAKYFSFTVYAGNVTSQGLDLKVFTPRPPGLN